MKFWISVLLALAVSLPAAAQDTASEAPAEGAAEASASEAPSQEPPEYVAATHKDWEIRCSRGDNTCFLYQLARNDAGDPVAEFSMILLPDESEAVAGVTVVTPLGTLLTEGLRVQVDSGNTVQYPFSWCTRVGCFARYGLLPQELQAMRAGNKATLTLLSIAAPGQPITVNLSLSGFTAAHEDLKVR